MKKLSIEKLINKFNSTSTKKKLDLEIKQLDRKKNNKAYPFKINNDLSGIFWVDDEKVTGITIIISPGESARGYLTIAIMIDIVTGTTVYDRNEVLRKLGMDNGEWIKGVETIHKGVTHKIYAKGGLAYYNLILPSDMLESS